MIFPSLEIESVLQVNDRTRLSAVKTYASKDGPAIAKVEIEPEAGAGFVNVTGASFKDWYTDWEYATAGAKVLTLRINDPTLPVTKTFGLTVLTAAADNLFASDSDLTQEEPDVLRYVKAGRNSYKDVHREAQSQIIDLLNRKGYRTTDGSAISKVNVVDLLQVREMAKYLALAIIFEGQSNQVGDVYEIKSLNYRSKYETATQRQIIGLDLSGDNVADTAAGEGVNLYAARMVRR